MPSSVDDIVKSAQDMIASGKLTEANELLADAVRIMDTTDICPKDTDRVEYKSFFKPVEEVLYYHLFKPEKTVTITTEDYSALYRMYGRLLFEKNDYDQAKINLIKAIKWNPMNLTARFEYAECYRAMDDMDMFAATNAEILKYSYHVRALSRAYSNLAFYFFEKEKYDLATSLIYVALEFDKDFYGAKNIFKYMEDNSRKPLIKPSEKTAKKLFQKNSIQWGALDEIISVLYSYGLHYAKLMQYRSAGYFLKYSYGLSADETVLRMLKILPSN